MQVIVIRPRGSWLGAIVVKLTAKWCSERSKILGPLFDRPAGRWISNAKRAWGICRGLAPL